MRWIVLVFCALMAAPAGAADPLTLIVLRMLRDHIITSGLEAAFRADAATRAAEPVAVRTYPGDVRAVVDQGFPYLDRAQRSAIFQSLMQVMNDPDHAAQKDAILAQFMEAASASRQAHEALSRLSDADKRSLAARAAESFRASTPEEREEMLGVLRSPAVPIPSDLKALMLSELAAYSAGSYAR